MSLPPIPPSEWLAFRLGLSPGVMAYTADQVQAYGQQCREQALLDAMNATLPFDKVGRVIAAAIGALK